MNITLPIRIESTANKREHWSKRAERARRQRNAMVALPRYILHPESRYMVKLTRIAPRMLDSDNAIIGCKACRDGIADKLGVKDNDPRITWAYAQEKGRPKEYALRIEITHSE